MGLESKACPYCGGNQLEELKGGGMRCAYCLQPLEEKQGILSEGYNNLALCNFAAAKTFFKSAIESGEGGAEAWYGYFLAKSKISENRKNNDIHPIVFSYQTTPFAQDPAYTQEIAAIRGNMALSVKLQKIEQARQNTLTPATPCDIVVYRDDGAKKESDAFCAALTRSGFAVQCYDTFTGADIATLRCCGGVYVFATGENTVRKLQESGIARKYHLLENERTQSGKQKSLVKLICAADAPQGVVEIMRDVVEPLSGVDANTEIRQNLFLLRGKSLDIPYVVAAPAVPLDTVKSRRKISLPSLSATDDDNDNLNRCESRLRDGDFTGVIRRCDREGDKASSRFCWIAYLASAGVHDEDELIVGADEGAFTPSALEYCDKALYRCKDSEEAKPYVSVLVKTALALAGRKQTALACRALDAAFTYDYANGYARDIFSALENASLSCADYLLLHKKVVEKTDARAQDEVYGYKFAAVEYALGCRDYAHAKELIETLLTYYPLKNELYERKLFCINRVETFDEILHIEMPQLGECFTGYLLTLPTQDERFECLLKAAKAYLSEAQTHGYPPYRKAINEVLLRLQMDTFTGGKAADADLFCRGGDFALLGGDFETAYDYYSWTIERDRKNYRAYWGILKAACKCRDDRQLEECDVDLESGEEEKYFSRADDLARMAREKGDNAADAFLARLDAVRRNIRQIEKKDGHIFRRSDFEIDGERLVRYVGKGTPRVYIGGRLARIMPNAFRGSDVQSVILDSSVRAVGDHAFAYSSLQRIAITGDVAEMGHNPFCGCDALEEVTGAGSVRIYGNGLYWKDRYVSFLPALQKDGIAEIKQGTDCVGTHAFSDVRLKEVRLPSSLREMGACAFYGCDGVRIVGNPPASRTALCGESAFGDCALQNGVLTMRNDSRWESLYGTGNNTACAPKRTKTSDDCRLLVDTCGRTSGQLLVKNDRVFYTMSKELCVASLADAVNGKAVTPAKVPLGKYVSGTGVLWRDEIIIPCDGGVLLCVNAYGKITRQIVLGKTVDRPLCINGNVLLCISDRTVFAVDVLGNTVLQREMPERITCVPCVLGNKFVIAGGRQMYCLDFALNGNAVYRIIGNDIGGKINHKFLQWRIVNYKNAVYWIEHNGANYLLGIFDGKTVTHKTIHFGTMGRLQTAPCFYGGKMFVGTEGGIVTAQVAEGNGDWLFTKTPINGNPVGIMAIGDTPFVGYESMRPLFVCAAYNGTALLIDDKRGGIYGGRI